MSLPGSATLTDCLGGGNHSTGKKIGIIHESTSRCTSDKAFNVARQNQAANPGQLY